MPALHRVERGCAVDVATPEFSKKRPHASPCEFCGSRGIINDPQRSDCWRRPKIEPPCRRPRYLSIVTSTSIATRICLLHRGSPAFRQQPQIWMTVRSAPTASFAATVATDPKATFANGRYRVSNGCSSRPWARREASFILLIGPKQRWRYAISQAATSKRAPTPAVSPIASAPQNVTRVTETSNGEPPALAAIRPKSARKESELPARPHMSAEAGSKRTISSGRSAPAAKVPAEAIAACTGLAAKVSDIPSSSRACAVSASCAINLAATVDANVSSRPRLT